MSREIIQNKQEMFPDVKRKIAFQAFTVLPCTMFQAIVNFIIHVTVLLSDQTIRMVRKKKDGEYKKKKWREEDMQQAVQKCQQEGWSVRQAASVLNVPRSTLSDR